MSGVDPTSGAGHAESIPVPARRRHLAGLVGRDALQRPCGGRQLRRALAVPGVGGGRLDARRAPCPPDDRPHRALRSRHVAGARVVARRRRVRGTAARHLGDRRPADAGRDLDRPPRRPRAQPFAGGASARAVAPSPDAQAFDRSFLFLGDESLEDAAGSTASASTRQLSESSSEWRARAISPAMIAPAAARPSAVRTGSSLA